MRKIILGFFILLSVGFFFPKMATGPWAKTKMISHLQGKLGGEVLVDSIVLSWTDKQACKQIQWKDQANNIALSADSLVISDHLLNCLSLGQKPLSVTVEGVVMQCEPKGWLSKKKKYRQLELKCSPIEATIHKRIISFEKTNIDVTDSLQITSWGKIDLEKKHLDITVGFPPKALYKMFGMKNLPEDLLLEVPISCKLSSKELEKKLTGFLLKNYFFKKS